MTPTTYQKNYFVCGFFEEQSYDNDIVFYVGETSNY
jgi:hypothetical protein